MSNWKKEFSDFYQERNHNPWESDVEKFIETEVITKLIADARHTFRHDADSFEEGEQQLKSRWLGKE